MALAGGMLLRAAEGVGSGASPGCGTLKQFYILVAENRALALVGGSAWAGCIGDYIAVPTWG